MGKELAKMVSWLFLPLFTPIYALLLVFYIPSQPNTFHLFDSLYHYPEPLKILILLLFVVFIVLAPGLSLLVLKWNGTISSLELDIKEERNTPISIMVFYSLVLYLFLVVQDVDNYVPYTLKGMVLGGVVASAAAYLFNKIDKLSLHGIGVGSLFGFIYSYYLNAEIFPVWVIVVVILVGSITVMARLFLQKHTLNQLFHGYLVGFLAQFLCIYFYSVY